MPTTGAQEGYLLPQQAAKLLRCTRQTVCNWIKNGCIINGRMVKLICEFIGVRHFIRPEWIEEFKAECHAIRTEEPRTHAPLRYDPSEGERVRREVAKELENW